MKDHPAKARRPILGVPTRMVHIPLKSGHGKLLTGLQAPALVALSRLLC